MVFKEILNIILINLLIFFALMSIHEIGHVATGMLFGCKSEAILIDSNLIGPYTKTYCSSNYFYVYFGSLIITSSFSLLFLLLKSSTRKIFLVSLGLSLLFSSLDISIVTNIQYLFYSTATLGFMIMLAGEYFIASSYVNNEIDANIIDAI